MKYVIVFITFGLVCAWLAMTWQVLAARLVAASFATAFCGVGLAYAFIGPRAFLKKSNGQLSILSTLFYAPYHLLNWLSLAAFRRAGHENAFDEIVDGVFLGCRLNASDHATIQKLDIKSVLDLTCEFSETPALRRLTYLCIPILDASAPSLKTLKSGAAWIESQVAHGPVYVHCALGHGRSATFVAAYLILAGKARTPREAIDKIKTLRPKVGLQPDQLALLEQFAAQKL